MNHLAFIMRSKSVLSAILAMFIITSPLLSFAESLRVKDGDTIKLDGLNIRLLGVDAPESDQKCLDKKEKEWDCGKASKAFLEGLVAGRQITCETVTLDRYKRSIAICHADKVEINKEIVRAGYGVAYIKYNDIYFEDQQYAKLNKHGIWQGTFIEPEKYRRSKKKIKSGS